MVLTTLLGASAAIAADPMPSSPPDIVVIGSGLRQPLGNAAYDVVTIDRNELAETGSGRLEDALRDAGVSRFRRADARSAHPTSQGATLRGLGGNAASRALVLLDGVPQADPFGGQISYPALDPSRLGMVRVTRGGGSGVYGPGALAGTIELESAGLEQLAPGWADVEYGSRDSVNADAGAAVKLGGGFVTLGGSYARGDGFIPTRKRDRGPVDKRAPYRQWSIGGRLVQPLGGDIEAQATVNAFGDKRNRGTVFTDNKSKGVDGSLRLVGRGKWGWSATGWIQHRRLSSGFASVNTARTVVTPSLDQYAVPADGVGGRFELRPPVAQDVEVRLGVDGQYNKGRTKENFTFSVPLNQFTMNRIAGGNNLDLGGFAEASVKPSDALTLTASGRIDRWWISDGTRRTRPLAGGATTVLDFPDRKGWRPTGRAGLAWKPAGAVTLRAAAYLGWRLPTLNELYRPFRVGSDSTVANDALKPERLKGVEIGVDYRPLSTLRFSATLFANKLEDAIANVTITGAQRAVLCPGLPGNGACRQRQNIDAIRSRGVELEANARAGDFDLDLSYAFTDARVHASGLSAPLDGLRPAQTPRHQLNGAIAWRPAKGPSAFVVLRYVSNQYDDDQNSISTRLRGAVTLDAGASVPVWDRFRVVARVENLANKLVDVGYSNGTVLERGTPRTLWIGLHWGG